MSPYYIKTDICGTSEWKEIIGYYVKRDGVWCEITEAHVKTDVCGGDSEWKQYYGTTPNINSGIVFWSVDTNPATGTVVADGSSISAASQPALHELLTSPSNLNENGDPLFGGDLTNPNLPDIQGSNRFIRARTGNSVTDGVGVTQSDAVQSHYHKYNKIDDGDGSILIPGPPNTFVSFNEEDISDLKEPSTFTNGEIGTGTDLASEGTETRPNNIAFTPVLGVEEVPTVPVGAFLWYTASIVPDGYLLCDGSAVTATHNDLRTILVNAGNPFGTDGSNPRLPDLVTDNRFIRGAGGSLSHGTTQTHTIATHLHNATVNRPEGIGDSGPRNFASFNSIITGPVQGATTDDETRPNSIALLPILKY